MLLTATEVAQHIKFTTLKSRVIRTSNILKMPVADHLQGFFKGQTLSDKVDNVGSLVKNLFSDYGDAKINDLVCYKGSACDAHSIESEMEYYRTDEVAYVSQ